MTSNLIQHFEQRQEVIEGKGMIVVMPRRIAADLYDEIIKTRPDWHSDDLDKRVRKAHMVTFTS